VSRACRQTKPAAFFIAASFASTIGNLESLVKRSKDADAGYNSVFVADELEKILALSRVMMVAIVNASHGGERFGAST
jgi:hypothetical protein